jgi:dihydroneopterin aldolase
MGQLQLEGMEFFAYHGCFKEEQIIGNPFLVDLNIDFNSLEAEQSDQLGYTINYVTIYDIVKQQMQIKTHLLEHLSQRIISSLKKEFPHINAITLKVSKLNPPVNGKMKQISFILKWTK